MPNELDQVNALAATATRFVVEYGFQMLGAVIILFLGFKVAGWVARLVAGACERRGVDVTLARFFGSVTKMAVLTFVVIIALGKFGITIAPFIAALGAIAFGGSLAIQGPLSNYGAGIVIILGRPFVVGNTITVQGVSGIVEEVALGATLLRTEDRALVTVPNRRIVGEILHNSFEHRIVESTISISYDDHPDRACELISAVLAAREEVASEPAPQVGIARFAESGIEIGIRYWVTSSRYHPSSFSVNQALYQAVREAGITIPYPRRNVQLLERPAAPATPF